MASVPLITWVEVKNIDSVVLGAMGHEVKGHSRFRREVRINQDSQIVVTRLDKTAKEQ